MLKNYFLVALRSLWRNKLIMGINIMGLSVGMASCLLIAIYVFHETSYDSFHENADRIVRATMEMSFSGNVTSVSVTGTRVLPEFKRTFPEVEDGVRHFPVSTVMQYEDKVFREAGFVYVDSSFFKIFSFRLLQGNPASVLNNPNQLVLSVSAARKYFGDDDAIGKVVRINNGQDFTVTGVVEDCPANSQIRFDMLASWASLTDPVYTTESWFDASHYTYLLLRDASMTQSFESKVQEYFKKMAQADGGENYLTIHVQPMKEVHLNAIVEGGFEPGSDHQYVYIFSIVALFILIIASANYINLVTARASVRAREVGLRKVVGASRRQLVVQFMGESILVLTVALLIALFLMEIALPALSLQGGKTFTVQSILKPFPLLTFLSVFLIISFVSGFYPALILSAFKPSRALKEQYTSGVSGNWFRNGLIVLQFFISVFLIGATLVIRGQLSFIQSKKLGYDKNHVIVLRGDNSISNKINSIKTEFLTNSNVLGVTTCNQTPVFVPGKYNLSRNEQQTLISGIRVDKDFIKTLRINLVVGEDFSTNEEEAAFERRDTIQRPIMINEAAARYFGWTPEEALNQLVLFQGRRSIIKAVTDDFHFNSMHSTIEPIVIFLSNDTRRILVKVSGTNLTDEITFLKTKWTELAPQLPFDFEFMDDQFNKLYSAEAKTSAIFSTFSFLGIVLATLGLLGLVTFTTQQRIKEIGIRKVLGASVINIVQLLSKNLMSLVAIATGMAAPVVWLAMNKWLQTFQYKISLSWWVILLASMPTILAAIITISIQAVRAALSNPVDSLRNE